MNHISEKEYGKDNYHDVHGYIEVSLTDITGKERHDYFPRPQYNIYRSPISWDPLQQLSFIADCHLIDVNADLTKPITIRYVPPAPK